MKTMKEWKREEQNPDDESLKAEFEAEEKDLDDSLAAEEEQSKRKQENVEPLIKASGLSKEEINRRKNKAKADAKASLQRAKPQLLKPPFDIEAQHSREQDLVKHASDQLSSGGNPYWHGYIYPIYGNYSRGWRGETQEVPSVSFDVSRRRSDPRAQAYGELWEWYSDYSRIDPYLAFRFNPPSWGHLHIYVYPWLHGYYHLYSDDQWWNSAYASAHIDTWVDFYQHFWRSRQSVRRFTLGGTELHPTRYGRIDARYTQHYYGNVGEGDAVTIRVGVRLYCEAKDIGSHSILDFRDGTANYIYIPYVYWYLHR